VAAGSPPAAGQTALVVGGGISGLLAARELARAGLHTTLLEAAEAWGGCVGRHDVAGLTLDSGAESFATRSTAVADLAAELGLGGHIVAPRPGGAWVQLPAGPRELPKTGVLGIPANPWDPEVRRSLGLAGSLRASLDKLLPASVGTTAEVSSVSALVRARMGRRVLERLVEPVVAACIRLTPVCSTSTWWRRGCARASPGTARWLRPWLPSARGQERKPRQRKTRQRKPGLPRRAPPSPA
jgi:oxygen-dependent protoporphyrinogen oxidase